MEILSLSQGAATVTGRRNSENYSRTTSRVSRRQLSLVDMRQVVTNNEVLNIETGSMEHRLAFLKRMRTEEAKADARVKRRLARRKTEAALAENHNSKERTRKSVSKSSVVIIPMPR